MLLDKNLELDPIGTALTATAPSTNVINLVNPRDIGIGGGVDPKLIVLSSGTFASAGGTATLNIQFQGAPDNAGAAGTYVTYAESGAMTITQLNSGGLGAIVFSIDLAPRLIMGPAGQGILPLPTWLRLNYVVGTQSFNAGTIYASIAIGADQPTYYPSGFAVPN